MEALDLGKLVEDEKLTDTSENIWRLLVNEHPDADVLDFVRAGKLVTKRSKETSLVYTRLRRSIHTPLYEKNKILLKGNTVSTHSLFQFFWPDSYYQDQLKDIDRKSIASFLGEEHFPFFQYSNRKQAATKIRRKGGKEVVAPYVFTHSARTAKYLNKLLEEHKAQRIATDFAIGHDDIEIPSKYRSGKLDKLERKHSRYSLKGDAGPGELEKLEEKIKSLEKDIKAVPEYQEIKNLFSKEPEYQNMLIKFINAITQKKGESDGKYVSRLITSCETFYKSKGLISEFFYVPGLTKLADDVDNTIYFNELGLEKQLERLDKNIDLLEKNIEFFNKYDMMDNRIVLTSIQDLLKYSILRSEKYIWVYSLDMEPIEVKEYKEPINKFMERYNTFCEIYQRLFPKENIPKLGVEKEKKKIMIEL